MQILKQKNKDFFYIFSVSFSVFTQDLFELRNLRRHITERYWASTN